MSTYNAAKHLNECLESLANQTYQDFVVKIVDDKSKDNSADIIQQWCEKDNRFEFLGVHQENKGLTASLNELISISETKYIARMDADDICLPDRLLKQVEFLENNPDYSIVGTWAEDVNDNGKVLQKRYVPVSFEEIRKMMLTVNPIIHPTAMFRRETLVSIGGYNEKYRTSQDYELWFRSISNGIKIANIPEHLLQYRVSENHVQKRSFSYRMRDAKIRWNGAQQIGAPFTNRIISTSIPIILGVLPPFLKELALKNKDRLDPRQKIAKRKGV